MLGLSMLGVACSGRTLGLCNDGSCAFSDDEWKRLQALTNLGPPPRDPSNAVDGDPAAIALGHAFFSDTRFAGPATQLDALRRPAGVGRAPAGQATNVSCVSCHDLGRAGVDTESIPGNVSSGAGWTDVNALPIVNCAYQRLFSWNGRQDSLWAQAFAVAESPTTMNGNRLRVASVIASHYSAQYDAVFARYGSTSSVAFELPSDGKPGTKPGCQPGDPGEPFGDAFDCLDAGEQEATTRVLVNWAKAIAAYEATLVSRNSDFDRFMREGPTSNAISSAAKRGARLFVSKAACIDCHATPLFSDRDFHNVGVSQIGPAVPTEADCPAGGVCDCVAGKNCLPWGALDGLGTLQASKMLRSSSYSDGDDRSRAADVTRALDPSLKGAWRTPSLRNVARTAPYMHDGVYGTLEEVVAHYNRGGDAAAIGTRAVDIKPLGLTADEQTDLVAFLETLSESAQPPPPRPSTSDGLPCAVATLLQQRCQQCHGTQPALGAPMSLVTYADLRGPARSNPSKSVAEVAVQRMRDTVTPMPPYPFPPATTDEAGAVSQWIAAGYPHGPACGASGGAGGAGSDAGGGPSACTGTRPPIPKMGRLGGVPFVFAAPNLQAPTVMQQGSSLYASIDLGTSSDPANSYVGFGIPFGCVDASAYTGVKFTVTGDLGTCSLRFGLVTSEDNSTAYAPSGTCAAPGPCVSPESAPIGLGTTVVRFSELSGGIPMPGVDPRALNGVQWLLNVPTDPGAALCRATLQVSDVAFVDACSAGSGGADDAGSSAAAAARAMCNLDGCKASNDATMFTPEQFCALFIEVCGALTNDANLKSMESCQATYSGWSTAAYASSMHGQQGCRSYHLCNATRSGPAVHCPHAEGLSSPFADAGTGPCP